MSLPKEKAWFPLKKYGYGWSFPVRWQGWVAVVVYVAAMAIAGIRFANEIGRFVVIALIGTGLFIGLCYWKGEEPKWR